MTLSTTTNNIKPTSTAEFSDILHTARYYVDALRTGDVDHSRKGFHKDATMYGHLGPQFSAGPIDSLFNLMREKGGTPELIYHLTVLATTPTTAIVEVDSELDNEGFRDHLVMVKVDGKWQIVSKIFHMYEAKA
ncbi:hypothetical protein BDV18DRAFT_138918 [Aspergillus unguis]